MIIFIEEPPDANDAIEELLDQGFGTDRHRKSSYSYRHGVEKIPSLCLTAYDGETLVGTIRAWPISIGSSGRGILVGPVAVDKEYRGLGLAARLIMMCLGRAKNQGWKAALLVGDKAYYGRFNFIEAKEFGIRMVRENPARVLALPLGNLRTMPSGVVTAARPLKARSKQAKAA